jgi:TatA/E family protein of Tat protein translocase
MTVGALEIVIVLVIVAALLFLGPERIPKLARSVGQAWAEFRRGKSG